MRCWVDMVFKVSWIWYDCLRASNMNGKLTCCKCLERDTEHWANICWAGIALYIIYVTPSSLLKWYLNYPYQGIYINKNTYFLHNIHNRRAMRCGEPPPFCPPRACQHGAVSSPHMSWTPLFAIWWRHRKRHTRFPIAVSWHLARGNISTTAATLCHHIFITTLANAKPIQFMSDGHRDNAPCEVSPRYGCYIVDDGANSLLQLILLRWCGARWHGRDEGGGGRRRASQARHKGIINFTLCYAQPVWLCVLVARVTTKSGHIMVARLWNNEFIIEMRPSKPHPPRVSLIAFFRV